MINELSSLYGHGNDVFESFSKNARASDSLFHLKDGLETTVTDKETDFSFFQFNIDNRLTPKQFSDIVGLVKPGKILFPDCDNDIYRNIINFNKYDCEFFILEKTFQYSFNEDVCYEKSFIITKNENDFIDLINRQYDVETSIDVIKENDNLFIQMKEEIKNKNKKKKNENNNFDTFEKNLKTFLEFNNMKLNEFLRNDTGIQMQIIKLKTEENEIDTYSDISIIYNNIDNNNVDNPEIEVSCENFEDSLFLNNLLQNIFN
jgi:hypothetical protein